MTLRLRFTAALAAATLALATFAGAADAGGATADRILLLGVGARADEIARSLKPLLGARGGVVVVTADELRALVPPPIDPAPAATATLMMAALEGAVRRFYYHPDRKSAEAALEESIGPALELLPRLLDPAALWEKIRNAELVLVAAAAQRGDAAAVAERARVLFGRDPAFEPSARDVPPNVRAVYGALRAAHESAARPLAIDGPPGTIAIIDGVPRGALPLLVRVAPGEHRVQGREGSLMSAVSTVKVGGEGARVRVEPFCAQPDQYAVGRCREVAAGWANAASVIVLHQRGGALVIEAVGQRTVPAAATELPIRLSAQWLAALADFVLGKRAAPPEAVLAAGTPLYKRWWFWTLVAAAAAGAAAALASRGSSGVTLIVETARP